MQIFKRIKQGISVIRGYIFKFRYDIFGLSRLQSLSRNHNNDPLIIVSLTSFGRRVKNVVPYTLISLLNQSKLPNKIILWLDKEHWNSSNIPFKLAKLEKFGIEIKFCEDLRSYKKLIPTLSIYHNDIIITVDDDIIYHKDFVLEMYKNHCEFPNSVICRVARFPQIDNYGNIEAYEKWIKYVSGLSFVMPVGAGGVLYPPNCLHKDVFRKDLFQKLSPIADDLWFWVMGLRNNTGYVLLEYDNKGGSNFDDLYQFLHKNTALTHQNRKCGKNDDQLKMILDYFKLDLTKIQSDINIIK